MQTTQVIVMTGCASGIGRHLTRALAGAYRILATDVNVTGLEQCARDDGWPKEHVRTAKLDVRNGGEWEEALRLALSAFGRVDVLMNVAGYLRPGYAHEVEPAEVDTHLDVNAKGVIHGCRVLGRHFAAQRSGHVINVGSLASLAPAPGLSLYVASKYAVRGFTLALSQELSRFGVHVTLVMPDAVQTPMLDLQVDYDEAALTFSGPRTLTVQDLERVFIEEVLPHRPLEVTIPMTRGLIARLASFVPGAIVPLSPVFATQGRKKQKALKALKGR
ncbi:MAG: SDR family oxidoreductase [Myxococcaceae bacterium]|jgi:3-oxoacyl-[acyl-carrier protein] reductase|nr:SDR family oxidoreductase [Myxococcaceae bacterium]MCA3015954.1 SDR family oxidoreductase [Myxococcaceae bacterium]